MGPAQLRADYGRAVSSEREKMMRGRVVFVESNTSGTGRLFARVAVEHGYSPVLLAATPSLYKYAQEDGLDVIQVNTQSKEDLMNVCKHLATDAPLAGITSSSEYYIATAAALAKQFGLAGPKPAAVQKCRDKRAQRERLKSAGIGVPEFRSVASIKAAVSAAREIGYPVVVKPVTGTGSAGVKLCEYDLEVAAQAGAILKQRQNERGLPVPRRLLVEQLAVGPEYSVETFGKSIIGITQKHLGRLPNFVEIGHDYPAVVSPEDEAAIHKSALSALESLDLGWGPAHLELRLSASGPTIIEVNPRLAGGFIPELVRLAQGIDLISETVLLASGQDRAIKKMSERYASLRFILPPADGVLDRAEGLTRAEQQSGVVEVRLYLKPGASVRRQGDFRDRIGRVIATGDTIEAARNAVERAHSLITLIVKTDSKSSAKGI
jgi:biotin carboxylase